MRNGGENSPPLRALFLWRRLRHLARRLVLRGPLCFGPQTVEYVGEFGRELKGVVPYAYWLHLRGRLKRTVSTGDTRCLYYFSNDHVERDVPRRCRHLRDFPIYDANVAHLDTWRWAPPPFKQHYANDRFRWDKPALVISNKYSQEWEEGPVNFLSLDLLRKLLALLQERYTVIYNRPGAGEIVEDHQANLPLGDDAVLGREFPLVQTMRGLWSRNRDLTFNSLQCMVYANCDRFISVQGGPSVLASYFGGANVIFVRKGSELDVNAYGWFSKLSGARVFPVSTGEALLSAVGREFC